MTFALAPERFAAAESFPDYIAAAEKNAELWSALYRTLPVPDDLVARASAVPGRWHLLALSEDWCIDAVSTLPSVAKFVERLANMDLRVLARDRNPDIMDAHLTRGTRSIPVLILLDESFRERGWWGPRPAELQEWMLNVGLGLPKDERNKIRRQWYARDRGTTVITDLVVMLEGPPAIRSNRPPRRQEGAGPTAAAGSSERPVERGCRLRRGGLCFARTRVCTTPTYDTTGTYGGPPDRAELLAGLGVRSLHRLACDRGV
ncbi:MAG: thioredoxin family protein [Gemmatimonadaceae bacterium]